MEQESELLFESPPQILGSGLFGTVFALPSVALFVFLNLYLQGHT